MRNNKVIILLLMTGLAIFSYPFIANYVSTTGHVKQIENYDEIMKELDEKQKKDAERRAKEHNEKIKEEEQEFIDPFDNGTEKAGSKSYYDALNIGEVMAVLDIPKLDLHLPIYHGSNEKVLSKGVGHLENSALPVGGEGTHSVLTAHRGLPSATLFRHLDKLEPGDVYFISVLDETYAYEVQEQNIVLPNETDWLQQVEGKELSTLLTCEPYMINTHRLLVTGERVPYEEAREKVSTRRAPKLDRLMVIGVVILFLFILMVLITKRRKKNE